MEDIKQRTEVPPASPQEREVLTALKEMAKRWRGTAAEIVDVKPPEGWPADLPRPIQSAENKAYCDGKARGLTFAAEQLEAAIAKAESAPSVEHEPGCDSRFCSACDWLASAHPLRASTSAGVTCETFTASQCNCKAQLASSVGQQESEP